MIHRNKLSILAMAALVLSVPAMAADEPTIKTGALLQTWLVNDTTVTAAKPDFRLRRAEFKLNGTVTESARWFVMADMAKALSASDGKFLQDLGVAFMIIPGLEITTGQFKTLTTAEGLEKSAELLLPERSIVGRSYGDRREPGAMLSYKLDKLQVSTMLSNGQGPNAQDTNAKKNLTARVDYEVIEGIKLGAFTQASDFSYNRDGRTGANVRASLGDLIVSAEGALGTLSGATTRGGQLTLAYSVTPSIQPVIRGALFTPDTNGNAAHEHVVGVNYYIFKQSAKVQLAYAYLKNLAGNSVSKNATTGVVTPGSNPGSPAYLADFSGSVGWLAFQAAF
jgi:hypothetical protein